MCYNRVLDLLGRKFNGWYMLREGPVSSAYFSVRDAQLLSTGPFPHCTGG